jgi:hypothetical protein
MEQFFMRFSVITAGAILIGVAGCSQNSGDQHRPTSQLTAVNAPRQAVDVLSAIDLMGGDLLNVPQLNTGGNRTIVITAVDNRTIDPTFTYGIFAQRLGLRLGQGRIVLVRGANGRKADFGLNITVEEMLNLTTSYYQIVATLSELHSGKQVWVSPAYDMPTNH